MNLFDWSKAPDWATCIVVPMRNSIYANHFWSEGIKNGVRMVRIKCGGEYTMSDPALWRIVEHRPIEQPSTAPELLNHAAQLLAERGKQYDKSGEERSAAAIVNAFNAITKRDLTPGEGWLFMVLLKAVRFYSNTETPHRDSLEDMIAYAALHAEEYLNDK